VRQACIIFIIVNIKVNVGLIIIYARARNTKLNIILIDVEIRKR